MPITLTPTQHSTLTHAVKHTGGKLTWFPDRIQGGARLRVIDALCKRGLVTPSDGDWLVTDAGHAAIGYARPRRREGSKQAAVVQMLQRPEGATVQQICALTHWQPHTVRGAFAGHFKKRLGLTIVSAKEGSDRIYRAL